MERDDRHWSGQVAAAESGNRDDQRQATTQRWQAGRERRGKKRREGGNGGHGAGWARGANAAGAGAEEQAAPSKRPTATSREREGPQAPRRWYKRDRPRVRGRNREENQTIPRAGTAGDKWEAGIEKLGERMTVTSCIRTQGTGATPEAHITDLNLSQPAAMETAPCDTCHSSPTPLELAHLTLENRTSQP